MSQTPTDASVVISTENSTPALPNGEEVTTE